MTMHTSQTIIWDDAWNMIQVKQHEFSKKWVFFVQLKSNKDWFYGEGDTLDIAIDHCRLKISNNHKMKLKPTLEELF